MRNVWETFIKSCLQQYRTVFGNTSKRGINIPFVCFNSVKTVKTLFFYYYFHQIDILTYTLFIHILTDVFTLFFTNTNQRVKSVQSTHNSRRFSQTPFKFKTLLLSHLWVAQFTAFSLSRGNNGHQLKWMTLR